MEVSNPRDDRAERNLGGASVPLSTVIPWVGNFHLEQNPILDSYIPATPFSFSNCKRAIKIQSREMENAII